MSTVKNRRRQPRGVPIGGQFAAELKDAADGVTLVDPSDHDENSDGPLGMSDSEVMQALWSKDDVLGLGVGHQAESRGVHVYYAGDDSEPIGIHQTPSGSIQLVGYEKGDYDFEYPRPMGSGTTSPLQARQRVAEHLGLTQEASRLLAFLPQVSDEQKALIAATYEEVNAGGREDVVDSGTRAATDAAYDGQVPMLTHIDHGQRAAAFAATKNEDPRFRQAIQDAMWALQRRDLVDDPRVSGEYLGRKYGWTRQAYDQMTRPVREVLGPIHPDDPPVERLQPGFEDDVIAEAYDSDNPRLRAKASQAARAVMADRLAQMGAESVTLYVRDGEVRVSSVGFPHDPDPDRLWDGYKTTRDIAEEYVRTYLPVDEYRAERRAMLGITERDDTDDFAAMTLHVTDYAGEGLASTVELREELLAQRHGTHNAA